ncbi:hypothetical protein [Candidatus Mycobacterium methanotrophicum]|uniref:DUF3631 domain-containing protein n=1 Tax=Candidatus Mycobacterium methanotrophicum TaxID=2943498 RepID=A0ABY4QTC9_9MYCO|nr:hypothetical protein [Candidatus Mycobacterium methanotrophicum]UQX13658.1 hypothetical protein M5I08_25595 [Candidatus Mycobacterium methanotrophicum]
MPTHWIADLVDTENADYHSPPDLPAADLFAAGISWVNQWNSGIDVGLPARWSCIVSRTVTARTVAVRHTILAVLRSEWPLPVPTGTVLLGMAEAIGSCNRPLRADAECRLLSSGSSCRAWCWYGPVYAQLRALSRLGLAEQIRRSEMPSAYWRYVPDDRSDSYFNAAVAEVADKEDD